MTGDRALPLPEAASALHPVGNRKPVPVSQRQPSDARGLYQKPLQSWALCPRRWTVGAFPPDAHRKALKRLQGLHHEGFSKTQFAVVARAHVALFQVLPCQTRVCGEKKKKSHKTQQPVKLYRQRRGPRSVTSKPISQVLAEPGGCAACQQLDGRDILPATTAATPNASRQQLRAVKLCNRVTCWRAALWRGTWVSWGTTG